jgi:TonB family protein
MPLLGYAQTKDTITTKDNIKEVVVNWASSMPEFSGGTSKMYNFLAEEIKYPIKMKKEDKSARVIVTFVVMHDGTLEDIKVTNNVEPEFADEAIRVVKAMPKWTPGKEKGEFVNVRFTMPIQFSTE